jgi:hypothetical protein
VQLALEGLFSDDPRPIGTEQLLELEIAIHELDSLWLPSADLLGLVAMVALLGTGENQEPCHGIWLSSVTFRLRIPGQS